MDEGPKLDAVRPRIERNERRYADYLAKHINLTVSELHGLNREIAEDEQTASARPAAHQIQTS